VHGRQGRHRHRRGQGEARFVRHLLDVFAFTAGGNKISLYLKGFPVDKALEGTVSCSKGKAKKITIILPKEIVQSSAGFASLTDLFVTIKKKSIKKSGKTTNLFETTGCPTSKKWPVRGDFYVFPDAPSSAGAPAKIFDTVNVPCTP
jgi:hypothetical protein